MKVACVYIVCVFFCAAAEVANVNSSNKRGRILNFLIVFYRFWSSYLYIYLSVIFSYSMAARINDPTDFGSFSITGSLI